MTLEKLDVSINEQYRYANVRKPILWTLEDFVSKVLFGHHLLVLVALLTMNPPIARGMRYGKDLANATPIEIHANRC